MCVKKRIQRNWLVVRKKLYVCAFVSIRIATNPRRRRACVEPKENWILQKQTSPWHSVVSNTLDHGRLLHTHTQLILPPMENDHALPTREMLPTTTTLVSFSSFNKTPHHMSKHFHTPTHTLASTSHLHTLT